MAKRWIIGGVAVAIIALTICGGAPYWTAYRFIAAAKQADARRLQSIIDYPAVRSDLKDQLAVIITKKMAGSSDRFMREIPQMVEALVDEHVAPEGLSALLKTGEPRVRSALAIARRGGNDVHVGYHYLSVDSFRVSLHSSAAGGRDPAFMFERRGIFSWKLVRLELPSNSFDVVS